MRGNHVSRALPDRGQAECVCPRQFAFAWESKAPKPATPVVTKEEPPTEPTNSVTAPPQPVAPASAKMGSASPALLGGKYPFREVVERFLRENGIPYINVDEAKKALFGGQKLRTFHFVVYRSPEKNWLLHTAQMRKEVREDLKRWVEIFGDGFIGVVAKQAADGTLKFKTLAGEPVEIQVPR